MSTLQLEASDEYLCPKKSFKRIELAYGAVELSDVVVCLVGCQSATDNYMETKRRQ
jgi:hypothetical protein